MDVAQRVAVLSAIGFFLLGLLGGIWKYAKIRQSPSGQAPVYVDIFHRTTLLYAFACLLLERMVELSALAAWIELCALAGLIGFFAFAVFGYAVHGWLEDTDNQLRRPYRLGARSLPNWVVHGSTNALAIVELGGFVVLALGVVLAIC